MKHLSALRLLASLCGALLAVNASAAITQFGFVSGMNGANEVPSNASAGSVTINTLEFDDSVGSFGTFTVNLDFTGLSGNASAAHIHGFAAPGANAGVLAGLTFTAATSGMVTGVWTLTSLEQVDGLFDGLTYINLHSTAFPGGELRGQLTPIPEPSSFAALAGMAVLGMVASRRRSRTA